MKTISTGMDNRLVLTVLFVMLSWMSAGTYAQTTNMTTPMENVAATNMTTPMENVTATNMTTPMENVTATNMTTPVANIAATNMTTPAANVAATNMTTPANVAATNMTTPANVVATNMTTPANVTATNMTTATENNTTAAPIAAPALTPNSTVEPLDTPVSRTGCGSQRLCGSTPEDCDPSTSDSDSCSFASFRQRNNPRDLDISISGESDGYIACTLSPDSTLGGNDETYVCANNNGTIEFIGAVLNNGQLTRRTLNVNSVRGSVTGRRIQCTFAATAPSSNTRAELFSFAISSGSFNNSNGDLGSPTPTFRSNVVDLTNPNATATNILAAGNTTTMSPNTTNHGITLRQSLTQAVLMTVGVLSLATL
ncbi:putative ferric-chelate reductase 1 isoform X2 [Cebidichthys violaceus]|uniref:putative ferric-chelate reductase 1 isoform X2 n=2 Tax=Cebidichthys violaceus TaxID=271503 RepID=UPI0035C9ED84